MPDNQNVYHVTLSDGSEYTVTTGRHHADHADHVFRQHLLDVIKSSISGIVSSVVTNFFHKGRKL